MRFSVLPFAALLCLVVVSQPLLSGAASAQDAGGGPGGGPGGGSGGGGAGPGADATGGAKTRLDAVLSVLRDHQNFAGKACLDSMTEVHKTEDQVSSLTQQDASSTRTDSSADIARDVLDSDYDTAETACRPDALRACAAQPADRSCARVGAGSVPPGP